MSNLLTKADLKRIYGLKRKDADALFATAYALDEPYRWWETKKVHRQTTDALIKKQTPQSSARRKDINKIHEKL